MRMAQLRLFGDGSQNYRDQWNDEIVKQIKKSCFFLFWLSISSACATPIAPQQEIIKPQESKFIQLTKQEAAIIGQKIWMNEGAGQIKHLTVWNEGETFASLGIGHFIWYPVGQEGPYQETFPHLLTFLQQQSITLPHWLQITPDCPWNSREVFYQDIQMARMIRLRQLLKETIPQQVQFIIQRLEQALPQMMAVLPTQVQRNQIQTQFYRVAQTPTGPYALIDYVNFKGEGISPKERYNGQGWGLLQVLENMSDQSNHVMMEFVRSADFVLTRRVQQALKDESRWLSGWRNRLQTYLD